MKLHCNGPNLKSKFSQLCLDQIDFLQKTDWLSLVFISMWVEYELVLTYSRAQNGNFILFEFSAIVIPIVNGKIA